MLLVDGDRQGRVLAAQMLAGLGFRVALADNAEEALGALGEGARFHAVLADVSLPGGGRELATRIRDIAPGLRVILTGEGGAEPADAYFQFLPINYSPEQLSSMLGPAV